MGNKFCGVLFRVIVVNTSDVSFTTLNPDANLKYGTAQFKLDTRVQQTCVHLTDFIEAHASCSHAGCMAREHMHDRIYSTRDAQATPRGTPEAYRMQTDALAWLMHGVKLIKWKGLALSYIQC